MSSPANSMLILPTHQLVMELRERLVSMNSLEYQIDDLASSAIAALSYEDKLTENRQRMLEQQAMRYSDPHDQQILTAALGDFFDSLNWLVNRLGLRDNSGALPYLFGRWLGADMVLDHFPY